MSAQAVRGMSAITAGFLQLHRLKHNAAGVMVRLTHAVMHRPAVPAAKLAARAVVPHTQPLMMSAGPNQQQRAALHGYTAGQQPIVGSDCQHTCHAATVPVLRQQRVLRLGSGFNPFLQTGRAAATHS